MAEKCVESVMRAVREGTPAGLARGSAPLTPKNGNAGKKPDYRVKRMVVRVTLSEESALKEAAVKARITVTDYIRIKALDHSRTYRTTASPTLDVKQYAILLGALNESGALLSRILSELEVGDHPLDRPYRDAAARVEQAADLLLRILESA